MSRGRGALLQWCQRHTEGYEGVYVTDFTTSWKDGLAFSALLDNYKKGIVGTWKVVRNLTVEERLTKAFAAAKKLGISSSLSVSDMTYPDEMSVITYLAHWYHTLKSAPSSSRSRFRSNRSGRLRSDTQLGEVIDMKKEVAQLRKEWKDPLKRLDNAVMKADAATSEDGAAAGGTGAAAGGGGVGGGGGGGSSSALVAPGPRLTTPKRAAPPRRSPASASSHKRPPRRPGRAGKSSSPSGGASSSASPSGRRPPTRKPLAQRQAEAKAREEAAAAEQAALRAAAAEAGDDDDAPDEPAARTFRIPGLGAVGVNPLMAELQKRQAAGGSASPLRSGLRPSPGGAGGGRGVGGRRNGAGGGGGSGVGGSGGGGRPPMRPRPRKSGAKGSRSGSGGPRKRPIGGGASPSTTAAKGSAPPQRMPPSPTDRSGASPKSTASPSPRKVVVRRCVRKVVKRSAGRGRSGTLRLNKDARAPFARTSPPKGHRPTKKSTGPPRRGPPSAPLQGDSSGAGTAPQQRSSGPPSTPLPQPTVSLLPPPPGALPLLPPEPEGLPPLPPPGAGDEGSGDAPSPSPSPSPPTAAPPAAPAPSPSPAAAPTTAPSPADPADSPAEVDAPPAQAGRNSGPRKGARKAGSRSGDKALPKPRPVSMQLVRSHARSPGPDRASSSDVLRSPRVDPRQRGAPSKRVGRKGGSASPPLAAAASSECESSESSAARQQASPPKRTLPLPGSAAKKQAASPTKKPFSGSPQKGSARPTKRRQGSPAKRASVGAAQRAHGKQQAQKNDSGAVAPPKKEPRQKEAPAAPPVKKGSGGVPRKRQKTPSKRAKKSPSKAGKKGSRSPPIVKQGGGAQKQSPGSKATAPVRKKVPTGPTRQPKKQSPSPAVAAKKASNAAAANKGPAKPPSPEPVQASTSPTSPASALVSPRTSAASGSRRIRLPARARGNPRKASIGRPPTTPRGGKLRDDADPHAVSTPRESGDDDNDDQEGGTARQGTPSQPVQQPPKQEPEPDPVSEPEPEPVSEPEADTEPETVEHTGGDATAYDDTDNDSTVDDIDVDDGHGADGAADGDSDGGYAEGDTDDGHDDDGDDDDPAVDDSDMGDEYDTAGGDEEVHLALPALEVVRIGEEYAAQWLEDGQWYRARVEEATELGWLLTFVDYGNQQDTPARMIRSLDNFVYDEGDDDDVDGDVDDVEGHEDVLADEGDFSDAAGFDDDFDQGDDDVYEDDVVDDDDDDSGGGGGSSGEHRDGEDVAVSSSDGEDVVADDASAEATTPLDDGHADDTNHHHDDDDGTCKGDDAAVDGSGGAVKDEGIKSPRYRPPPQRDPNQANPVYDPALRSSIIRRLIEPPASASAPSGRSPSSDVRDPTPSTLAIRVYLPRVEDAPYKSLLVDSTDTCRSCLKRLVPHLCAHHEAPSLYWRVDPTHSWGGGDAPGRELVVALQPDDAIHAVLERHGPTAAKLYLRSSPEHPLPDPLTTEQLQARAEGRLLRTPSADADALAGQQQVIQILIEGSLSSAKAFKHLLKGTETAADLVRKVQRRFLGGVMQAGQMVIRHPDGEIALSGDALLLQQWLTLQSAGYAEDKLRLSYRPPIPASLRIYTPTNDTSPYKTIALDPEDTADTVMANVRRRARLSDDFGGCLSVLPDDGDETFFKSDDKPFQAYQAFGAFHCKIVYIPDIRVRISTPDLPLEGALVWVSYRDTAHMVVEKVAAKLGAPELGAGALLALRAHPGGREYVFEDADTPYEMVRLYDSDVVQLLCYTSLKDLTTTEDRIDTSSMSLDADFALLEKRLWGGGDATEEAVEGEVDSAVVDAVAKNASDGGSIRLIQPRMDTFLCTSIDEAFVAPSDATEPDFSDDSYETDDSLPPEIAMLPKVQARMAGWMLLRIQGGKPMRKWVVLAMERIVVYSAKESRVPDTYFALNALTRIATNPRTPGMIDIIGEKEMWQMKSTQGLEESARWVDGMRRSVKSGRRISRVIPVMANTDVVQDVDAEGFLELRGATDDEWSSVWVSLSDGNLFGGFGPNDAAPFIKVPLYHATVEHCTDASNGFQFQVASHNGNQRVVLRAVTEDSQLDWMERIVRHRHKTECIIDLIA